MKKLLTVFTAAGLLVAGGSSALALEGVQPGSDKPFEPFVGATDTDPGHLSDEPKAGINAHLEDTTKDRFPGSGEKLTPKRGKDGKIISGQFVVTGKVTAPAKKAEPNKGLRFSPKTSASK